MTLNGAVIHLQLGPRITLIDGSQLMSRFPLLQGQLAESTIAEQVIMHRTFGCMRGKDDLVRFAHSGADVME